VGERQERFMAVLAVGVFQCLRQRRERRCTGRKLLVTGDVQRDQPGEARLFIRCAEQPAESVRVGVPGQVPGGLVTQVGVLGSAVRQRLDQRGSNLGRFRQGHCRLDAHGEGLVGSQLPGHFSGAR
jgi:hypothetical protein